VLLVDLLRNDLPQIAKMLDPQILLRLPICFLTNDPL
jgi:hypothetical protein